MSAHARGRSVATLAAMMGAIVASFGACGGGDRTDVVDTIASITECRPIPTDAPDDDPVALVRAFAARDAAGDMTEWGPWLASVLVCPEEMSSERQLSIIRGYTVAPLAGGVDTVQVVVTSEVVGRLVPAVAGSMHFQESFRMEADTFVVARTPLGWRLIPPVREPARMLGDTALARLALPANEAVRLRDAIATSRVVPPSPGG